MTITIDDITVKIKLLKSETILAQATVILFDIWKEHGWKVLKSDREHPKFQEYLWIQAPSYKYFGEWREIIFIDDRQLYEQVQEKIYDAYHLARSKQPNQYPTDKEEKQDATEEKIDIDSIPL